jgi:hypothetical protein
VVGQVPLQTGFTPKEGLGVVIEIETLAVTGQDVVAGRRGGPRGRLVYTSRSASALIRDEFVGRMQREEA